MRHEFAAGVLLQSRIRDDSDEVVRRDLGWRLFAIASLILALTGTGHATTKGLSQIVTPDLQPPGELSVSFQAQSRKIGNPYQLQAELGFTNWLEAAVFQGLSPEEETFATLVGLVDRSPWLVTTGFVGWSTRGDAPQPFLEGGYYLEHDKLIAGTAEVDRRIEAILGWAHDFDPTWRFQIDFQSGRQNFSTVGFTWNMTSALQLNPALYVANDHSHRALGYVVVSYTLSLWKD